jgi:hypothetical protein
MRTGPLEALSSIESALFSHAKTMQGGTNTALVHTQMKVTQKRSRPFVVFRQPKTPPLLAELKI